MAERGKDEMNQTCTNENLNLLIAVLCLNPLLLESNEH